MILEGIHDGFKVPMVGTIKDPASFQYYPIPIMFNASVASRYALTSYMSCLNNSFFWRSVGKRGQLDMNWKKRSYKSARRQLLDVF